MAAWSRQTVTPTLRRPYVPKRSQPHSMPRSRRAASTVVPCGLIFQPAVPFEPLSATEGTKPTGNVRINRDAGAPERNSMDVPDEAVPEQDATPPPPPRTYQMDELSVPLRYIKTVPPQRSPPGGYEGTVPARVVVGTDGRGGRSIGERPTYPPGVCSQAERAARQVSFTPGRANGRTVRVQMQVFVSFRSLPPAPSFRLLS